MKKKIIVLSIIAIIIIISIIFNIQKTNRYSEIKEDVRKEAIAYLTLIRGTNVNLTEEEYLYEDDIINPLHRGADKKILLDIDKKSYCKVAIKGFINNNKWDANVYLKCNKYEDKLYEETLLMYLCIKGVPEGYEDYYKKYGMQYDNFVCPKDIQEKIKKQ